MSQMSGMILSYVFVFAIILVATFLQLFFKLSSNFSRKIIHIGVGNWIFVALYCFTDWYLALIPPFTFVLINYFSYRFSLFKAMELDEKNPGTIYYAISLTILTLLVFYPQPLKIMPYLGIVVMTWGDGMAAVIGSRWPIYRYKSGKSMGGSIAFTAFAMLFCMLYLGLHSVFAWGTIFVLSLVFASIGTLVEVFSPKNLDNLTVPLITGILGLIFEIMI